MSKCMLVGFVLFRRNDVSLNHVVDEILRSAVCACASLAIIAVRNLLHIDSEVSDSITILVQCPTKVGACCMCS